jgi:hypothetical protein
MLIVTTMAVRLLQSTWFWLHECMVNVCQGNHLPKNYQAEKSANDDWENSRID